VANEQQKRVAVVKRHKLLQTLCGIGRLANTGYVLHAHNSPLRGVARERYGYNSTQALQRDLRLLRDVGRVETRDCSFRCEIRGKPYTSNVATLYGPTNEGKQHARKCLPSPVAD